MIILIRRNPDIMFAAIFAQKQKKTHYYSKLNAAVILRSIVYTNDHFTATHTRRPRRRVRDWIHSSDDMQETGDGAYYYYYYYYYYYFLYPR